MQVFDIFGQIVNFTHTSPSIFFTREIPRAAYAETCRNTGDRVTFGVLVRLSNSRRIILASDSPAPNLVTARFITFEGIDGCGKSTQLRLLARHFDERGTAFVMTREPGGTPLGLRLRHALLDADSEVDPLAELLLYAADRAQHVRALIRPSLANGRTVLSDRYADATVAYQGAGRGFDRQLISKVIDLATEGLQPDLTLLFDLPVEQARSRRKQGLQPDDRLEAEATAFHERVRQGYLEIAAREPSRVRVINANETIEIVHERVLEEVAALFDTAT